MGTIGERLKLERERLFFTQEKLAEYGGVLKRSQVNYEKGDRFPDAKYLEGVAKAGVDVLYVLTGQRSGPSAADVPVQQLHSSALQIEETPAGYDLGPSKEAPQRNDRDELTKMQLQLKLNKAEMETLKAQAEAANERAEAAKALARAEIAEAKLEMCQSQINDFQLVKSGLKRAERKLAETEQALARAQGEIAGLKRTKDKSKLHA